MTITVGDRLLSLVDHLRIDTESDEVLEALVGGWGDMLERAALVAYGDPSNGIRPLQILIDPAVAPLWALPHAVLYSGGVLPARLDGETDDAYLERARAEVVYPRGMWRGSARALQIVLAPLLTGTRYVRVIQRYNGDVWRALVIVKVEETPDPAAVVARATAPDVVVAGMRITLVVVDAPIIDEVDYLTINEARLTFDAARNRRNWEAL